jgi:hypothetical protein
MQSRPLVSPAFKSSASIHSKVNVIPPNELAVLSLNTGVMHTSARLPTSSYKPVAQVHDIATDKEHVQVRNASLWDRLIPFYIVVPTLVSLCVLVLHTQQYKDTGKLYQWSIYNRALL